MAVHSFVSKPAPLESLMNISQLVGAYYTFKANPNRPQQLVSYGTSGRCGSSRKNSFNEDHILAISQAICEYRKSQGIRGSLFLGKDTHALSEPVFATALEIFAVNDIDVMIDKHLGFTPTPVISHEILIYNREHKNGLGDGVIITSSHNPPGDGGLKYNLPIGGPADSEITSIIKGRANEILQNKLIEVKRLSYEKALKAFATQRYYYIHTYVDDLDQIIQMEQISKAGLKIRVDLLGGSGLKFRETIADKYGLDIQFVNPRIDPSFSFMTLDQDGKICLDCFSPYAMVGLIQHKDKFDIAFCNDLNYDRHGIVTRTMVTNES